MPLHNKLNYIIFSVTLSSVITFALLCSLPWLARTFVLAVETLRTVLAAMPAGRHRRCVAVTVLSQANRML